MGANKPVFRFGLIGKLNAGMANNGTPLKFRVMLRAVPIPSSGNRSMLFARINQLSSPGGQVE